MSLTGYTYGIGVAPQLASAQVLSFMTVRLTFSEPMTLDTALLLPANYVVSAGVGSDARAALSLVPGPGVSPTFVDLYLDGPMTPGVGNYTVEVTNVVDAVGNTIDPAHDTLTFGPGPNDFRVLLVTPVESNLLRVYFTQEPRHLSPLGDTDALSRLNWSISIASGLAPAPVVERVENALARPLDVPGYAAAWSVDLRVDRVLQQRAWYLVVASSAIVSATGVTLSLSPYDRGTSPGIMVPPERRPRRPRTTTRGTDFFFDTFAGRYVLTSSGDIAVHSGLDALKKRIIRRLITTPGSFSHLPSYGAGLRAKRLFTSTEVASMRGAILRQVRQEEEVADASVAIDLHESRLYVKVTVRVKVRTGGAFALGFEVPEEGPILLSAA